MFTGLANGHLCIQPEHPSLPRFNYRAPKITYTIPGPSHSYHLIVQSETTYWPNELMSSSKNWSQRMWLENMILTMQRCCVGLSA